SQEERDNVAEHLTMGQLAEHLRNFIEHFSHNNFIGRSAVMILTGEPADTFIALGWLQDAGSQWPDLLEAAGRVAVEANENKFPIQSLPPHDTSTGPRADAGIGTTNPDTPAVIQKN